MSSVRKSNLIKLQCDLLNQEFNMERVLRLLVRKGVIAQEEFMHLSNTTEEHCVQASDDYYSERRAVLLDELSEALREEGVEGLTPEEERQVFWDHLRDADWSRKLTPDK